MNPRVTIVLLLVFAGLAFFAWSLRDQEPRQYGEDAPDATAVPLWDATGEDLTEVLVEGPEGSLTLTRVGDGWEVDEKRAASDVDAVLGGVAELETRRELPAERDPADYGLATPAMTVTLKTADAQLVLLVGDQAPASSDFYVRRTDGQDIRLVAGFDLERLQGWLTDPPYEPTATPEPTATVEVDAELPPLEGEGESEEEGEVSEGGAEDAEDASSEDGSEGTATEEEGADDSSDEEAGSTDGEDGDEEGDEG